MNGSLLVAIQLNIQCLSKIDLFSFVKNVCT